MAAASAATALCILLSVLPVQQAVSQEAPLLYPSDPILSDTAQAAVAGDAATVLGTLRPTSSLRNRIRGSLTTARLISSEAANRPVPANLKARPISRQIAALPQMEAVGQTDLRAEYTGVRAASAHGIRSTGSIKPQANSVAGASFTDSRFSPEYYTLAHERVGVLLSRYGEDWYSCTASVINTNLLVTAAHCVCVQDLGKGPACLADQVMFEPGRAGGPLLPPNNTRLYSALGVMVPRSYAYQTDTNYETFFTNNDLALVWLGKKNDTQIGDKGWFGYGTNGYSFSEPVFGYGGPPAPASAMMTQFGYPVDFDKGDTMQIGNAATYVFKIKPRRTPPLDVRNIVRGSAMIGGASGGPWIANYGIDADLAGEPVPTYGRQTERNIIMGVLSWIYVDSSPDGPMLSGSSFFGNNKEFPGTYGTRGNGNIAALMYDACDNPDPSLWNLKAKGLCV